MLVALREMPLRAVTNELAPSTSGVTKANLVMWLEPQARSMIRKKHALGLDPRVGTGFHATNAKTRFCAQIMLKLKEMPRSIGWATPNQFRPGFATAEYRHHATADLEPCGGPASVTSLA